MVWAPRRCSRGTCPFEGQAEYHDEQSYSRDKGGASGKQPSSGETMASYPWQDGLSLHEGGAHCDMIRDTRTANKVQATATAHAGAISSVMSLCQLRILVSSLRRLLYSSSQASQLKFPEVKAKLKILVMIS